jgi:hypothetical protein
MSSTITTTPPVDEAKVAAFSQRLVDMISSGALNLMISIGHRTGLFDLMADLPPATSTQIARQAGLNERYVREWLGAMVTGHIVNYDPADETYELPAEHAACLTRGAIPANFAATMQWFSVLGGVEDKIVECFQRGGGVHYEEFHRFHEVMA